MSKIDESQRETFSGISEDVMKAVLGQRNPGAGSLRLEEMTQRAFQGLEKDLFWKLANEIDLKEKPDAQTLESLGMDLDGYVETVGTLISLNALVKHRGYREAKKERDKGQMAEADKRFPSPDSIRHEMNQKLQVGMAYAMDDLFYLLDIPRVYQPTAKKRYGIRYMGAARLMNAVNSAIKAGQMERDGKPEHGYVFLKPIPLTGGRGRRGPKAGDSPERHPSIKQAYIKEDFLKAMERYPDADSIRLALNRLREAGVLEGEPLSLSEIGKLLDIPTNNPQTVRRHFSVRYRTYGSLYNLLKKEAKEGNVEIVSDPDLGYDRFAITYRLPLKGFPLKGLPLKGRGQGTRTEPPLPRVDDPPQPRPIRLPVPKKLYHEEKACGKTFHFVPMARKGSTGGVEVWIQGEDMFRYLHYNELLVPRDAHDEPVSRLYDALEDLGEELPPREAFVRAVKGMLERYDRDIWYASR